MSKNICVGTLNSEYLPGAIAFFKSLLYHNKFNLPFLIYTWDNSDFTVLKNIYNNISFVKVQSTIKDNVHNKFRKWKYDVFIKLELFNLSEYDKVYFFDFDLIVNNNIEELFNVECNFGAVKAPTCSYRYLYNVENYFDAGVLIVGKKYLNNKTYLELIELSQTNIWAGNEPLLNEYFFNKTTFLNKKYNTLTVDDISNLNEVSILQYVGAQKPWNEGELTKKYTPMALRNNNIISIHKAQALFNSYYNIH